MKNVYMKRSHLRASQARHLIRCFAIDLTAYQASRISWIHVNTVEKRYNYIRRSIHRFSQDTDKEVRKWIVEADESYFGPKRIRGKRWRWAGKKIKVLWLRKRQWKVYVHTVPNCKAKYLLPIIRGKVVRDSIMNTDGWSGYHGLIDLWYKKHRRVRHSKNEFAIWAKHVNGIESFRSFMKRRIAKFNWIPDDKFILHMKESEFRFNCWVDWTDMYKQLLFILKRFAKVC